MNKTITMIIMGFIGIIIIGIVFGFLINNEKIDKSQKTISETNLKNVSIIDTKQKSGPFQINKSDYNLGDYIFLHVEGLQNNERGEIVFLKSTNSTHYLTYKTIPFNGKMKTSFNQIIDIELAKHLNLCNSEDISGNWRIWFKGTEYQSIDFNMNEKVIEGETKFLESVC